MTERSHPSLKTLARQRKLVRAMASHSPISALLAERAGFEAVWASGFELSALYGLADMSLTSIDQHVDMVRATRDRTDLPIIADVDTGYGNALNVMRTVRLYERAGASAIVIEDKHFPKVTSLREGGAQTLVDVREFQGKLEAALDARTSDEFLIIGRTEALIAGRGVTEAIERATAYAEAGSDMIFVHSKQKTPDEIEAFLAAWTRKEPVVIVPTSYPQFTEARAAATGKVGVVIYGNHAIRASVKAMREVFTTIARDGSAMSVAAELAPLDEIFELQDMARVEEAERRFIR